MKTIKLLICVLTLNIGFVYAGCMADISGVPLDDKQAEGVDLSGGKINICTKSGKDFIDGVKGLGSDIAKKVAQSVNNCNCDLEGNEADLSSEDKKSTFCGTTRSIEIDNDGNLKVEVKSSNVTAE